MRFISSFACLALALPLSVVACGGGQKEPASASTTSADLSPMDELSALPKSIDADVQSLTKPIDDVDAVVERITSLPKRHNLNAAEITQMAKATCDGGKVDVQLKGDVSAEAKAEVEAALKQLAQVVTDLKATPEKAAALGKTLVAATAKVPVLATKVSAGATATLSNPFGSAEDKAKAQASVDSLEKVKADVQKSISDAQAKVAGVPALATTALGKLTAAFAGA